MKNMKTYREWSRIFETVSEKLPPLVQDFILELENDNYIYTDWWCVAEEKTMLDTIFGFSNFQEDTAATNFETQQRKMPQDQRLLSNYFLLEFEFRTSTSHQYFLTGIDMKRKEVHCKDGKWSSDVRKTFDFSLKKFFPTQHTSRKMGL